jgi:hypothetical protein
VYVVIWGPHYPGTVVGALQHFIAGLHRSAFGAVLTEYYDTTGRIHNDTTLASTWTDPNPPPSTVSLADLDLEVQRAVARAGWPVTTNMILAVLLPPGVPPVSHDSCGSHGAALTTRPHRDPLAINEPPAYVVIPYPSPQCRYRPNDVDDLTFVLSHELAEAITDPFNTGSATDSGWWGFTNGLGNPPPLAEIADACEPTGSPLTLTDDGNAYVSNLYDLDKNRCISFQ